MRPKHPEHFVYHVMYLLSSYLVSCCSDSVNENLIPHFPQAFQFINSALSQHGKVLVQCNGGISRSPSFIVAYLMESRDMDFHSAYSFVQNKRFCINPNEGFKYQLKEYEPIFKAKRMMSQEDYHQHRTSKRHFQEAS